MAKIGINLATGGIQDEDIIVGIDLGTTNSLIALIHPDTQQPVALKDVDGLSLVPSVIYFDEYNQPIVGTEAVKMLALAPERTIYSAKRLMGKSYSDIAKHAQQLAYKLIDDDTETLVKVQVGDKVYSPVELSSLILRELKQRAEHVLKTTVSKAVITVPAYFNDVQRQATRDAGKLAGLDVLRIVNEPTAASLAYNLGKKNTDEQTIAVYDLGGGTFDVSILKIQDGVFEVLSTNGDTFLGGDDVDNAIIQFWLDQQQMQLGKETLAKSQIQLLRLQAEKAKKHLSDHEQYEAIDHDGHLLSISRDDLKKIATPIIEKTVTSCRQSLQDAKLTIQDIDAVVLVGGSTRMPLVKDAVKSFFQKDELYDQLHPDETVAQGAAVQADILAGKNVDVLLLDVTPLSLGLETMGGLMDVLIPRNSKIPGKAGRQYTTQKDGQSSMRISVYQGERDLVKNNRKLAEFNLQNIPGMPAGLPKVEVTFMLDADGILKVSATELRSGVAQEVDVKPQFGLTDAEVEQMLLDSLTHAKEDIAERALTEASTEAQQLLEATERFLHKYESSLSAEEVNTTHAHMKTLQNAMQLKDKHQIQIASEQLNEVSRPYAERVMEQALKSAMKGKKI